MCGLSSNDAFLAIFRNVNSERRIIHIDMDAFYAAVEQRDNPDLAGRPVIVGGPPHSRGVVATCSYEARRFGVHSAMASARAARICPEAVFLPPRFPVYRRISLQIRALFRRFTDLVEPLSLDEAFLDVTENKPGIPSATEVAHTIKNLIREQTGLSASAGVSYNKFLAKVASDWRKPDGLTVVRPRQAAAFIAGLPIGKFFGVGPVTERRMHELGIHVGADLLRYSREEMVRLFGKAGLFYFDIARGIDERPVCPDWERKSLGKETTLAEDIGDRQKMLSILEDLGSRVEQLMEAADLQGHTLTLKVRYADFTTVTRSISFRRPLCRVADVRPYIKELLARTGAGERKVRLLGLTFSNFRRDAVGSEDQLSLPFGQNSGMG